jgi:bifunctional non-homologous end joining protein LigD
MKHSNVWAAPKGIRRVRIREKTKIALVRKRPETFTDRFAKAGRSNKILLDYLRNNRTNTSIAAYSTRARPHAPVSVPVGWSELGRLSTPDRFTLATVPARLAKLRMDPWKGYAATRQRLPRNAVRALEAM